MLQQVVPSSHSRLLYLDHIEDQGVELFKRCRELDLDGVVAKPRWSPYRERHGRTTWLKVKNPDYSQAEGRLELFDRRRG